MSFKICLKELVICKSFILDRNLSQNGQLKLAMLFNRVDIARSKIFIEGAKQGLIWTVKCSSLSCQTYIHFIVYSKLSLDEFDGDFFCQVDIGIKCFQDD